MSEKILSFYESLADHYHLIFDDWDRAIARQARILNSLLSAHTAKPSLKILDCACGIGTQAIGLALLGHHVMASDLSPAAVERARREAGQRALDISFRTSDMISLAEITESDFDAVIALDNALPHLDPLHLQRSFHAIASKLVRDGAFLASIRDYDQLIQHRPTMQAPAFYGAEGNRRIVHQVWDWKDEERYTLHLYLTVESPSGWQTRHFISEYRCLLRNDLSSMLELAGFQEVSWLMPAETGFYQPLVIARRV